MTRYWTLQPPKGDQYCFTGDIPEEMPNAARPSRGKSMAGSYAEPVALRMHDLFKGLIVPDVIANGSRYLLVSEATAAVLREHVQQEVEYLPFRLLNHKGRVAAERCFIVNVIGTIACGDPARSEGVAYPNRPGQLFSAKRLAVSRRFWLDEWRRSPAYQEEVAATEAAISVRGLAWLRLAELRQLRTAPEYDLMPQIARIAIGTPLPGAGAWRNGEPTR